MVSFSNLKKGLLFIILKKKYFNSVPKKTKFFEPTRVAKFPQKYVQKTLMCAVFF